MRRLLFAVLAFVLAAAVVGCGSSSRRAGSSPTLQTLSYFPTGAPFVMTVPTDPQSPAIKNAKALEQRFPQAALLQTGAFSRLAQLGINYNKQVKPLFGNPFAIGVLSAQSGGTQAPFLGVWVTRSADQLQAVIKKLNPALQSVGSHDGAKLYRAGGEAVGIDGATLLIARTTQDIETALDRHKGGQGISSAQYSRLTSGIATTGLVQMFGDLTQALSTPKAAKARRIPWVAAIRGYGASIGLASSGLSMQFHLDTSGRQLSSAELPLAAGSTPPGVVDRGPIQMGLRDLSQSIRFTEAAVQATDPAQYATFTRKVSMLKRRGGFDLGAFVATLSGTLNISSDTKRTIGRVGVSDPGAVSGMLAKLAAQPGLAFKKGTQVFPLGHGLYDIQERSGMELTAGVVSDQLVVGRATAAEIRAFATAPTVPVAGAAGAVSFRVALLDLLHVTLKQAPSPIAQQFLKLLGDVTGSASVTPSGLTGSAKLALK